jgi:coatomer protein complex subunit gamma
MFSDRELSPLRCSQVLTKLLYLMTKGEDLDSSEATDVFFGVTKLFQSNDPHLRRLIYLMIKELSVSSDSSLIVVACLSKDMTSKIDLFRANSIRVLARIMDQSMVSQMDRFLKQSLVDRNPFIVVSTLVAGQILFGHSSETIKRWLNEIQEALNNKNRMVPYHALALLYKIKQADKLAINKIVTAISRQNQSNNSPLAQVLHIRIIFNLLNTQQPFNAELFKYLLDCLHNKNFMVQFEAAKSICRLENLQAVQVVPAVGVLTEMLSSAISVQRFAAVRVLSELVVKFPLILAPSVTDLEHLITDSNRNIATLAITTLLKTGVESNVDRLLKSLQGFMSETSDEFKIVLVDAIRSLCTKFPSKYQLLLNFFITALREEGGYKYKKSIVDAMLSVINEIKEALELGLEHFCEFIEDCEFPELSIRIIHFLGEKGPQTSNPAKYIRYIFNRVILETASVRSAAVTTLAKFGVAVPVLRENCVVLLKRCLADNDDEVRDRAVFYLNMFNSERSTQQLLSQSIRLPNLHLLEVSLQNYLSKQQAALEPFDLDKHLVKLSEEQIAVAEGTADSLNAMKKQQAHQQQQEQKAKEASDRERGIIVNPHAQLLNSIPELKQLGELFKSSLPLQLTEPETEYVVQCIKHIYPAHVLFQFSVTNNLEDHALENIQVAMECEDDKFSEDFIIPENQIKHGAAGAVFVAFNRPNNHYNSGSISCTLKFTVKEVEDGEISAEGHDDEYQLEELELSEADFMRAGENIGLVEFRRQWESLGDSVEVVKKYSLGLDSLQSAVDAVVELLGMQACEGSNIVPEKAEKGHAVNLTGSFYGGINVLARAGFMLDPKHGVTVKIAVRSTNANINNMLASAIR